MTSMLGHHGNIGRSFATQTANPSKVARLDAYFPQGVAHKAIPVIAVSASSLASAGARVTRCLHETWSDF